jgi:hypothetical protein
VSGIRTDGLDPEGDAMREAINARWAHRIRNCPKCGQAVIATRARDATGAHHPPNILVDYGPGPRQARPWNLTWDSRRFEEHRCHAAR